MGRSITQIYMLGRKKCFWVRITTFRLLFTGVMDLHPPLFSCRRIPLESIPEDEAECAAWLHKLYQEKVRQS